MYLLNAKPNGMAHSSALDMHSRSRKDDWGFHAYVGSGRVFAQLLFQWSRNAANIRRFTNYAYKDIDIAGHGRHTYTMYMYGEWPWVNAPMIKNALLID